jgi:hypothetical protein
LEKRQFSRETHRWGTWTLPGCLQYTATHATSYSQDLDIERQQNDYDIKANGESCPNVDGQPKLAHARLDSSNVRLRVPDMKWASHCNPSTLLYTSGQILSRLVSRRKQPFIACSIKRSQHVQNSMPCDHPATDQGNKPDLSAVSRIGDRPSITLPASE